MHFGHCRGPVVSNASAAESALFVLQFFLRCGEFCLLGGDA